MAMITMIKKRDGRQVPFNIEKIANAILKAAQTVGGKDYSEAMELADKVCQQLSEEVIGRDPSVEEVQDMVERVLVEQGHAQDRQGSYCTATDRTRAREMNYHPDEDIRGSDLHVRVRLATSSVKTPTSTATPQWVPCSNTAAKAPSSSTRCTCSTRSTSKAHIEGDIHIHDLDFLTLTTTCCQIDLAQAVPRRIFHRSRLSPRAATILPATRRWPALPFSLTRTTSTADSPCPILRLRHGAGR